MGIRKCKFQLRRTKILATLGPATDAPGVLDELIRAGVNVVRMNFSHGTPEDHADTCTRSAGVCREAGARSRHSGRFAGPENPYRKIRQRQDTTSRLATNLPWSAVPMPRWAIAPRSLAVTSVWSTTSKQATHLLLDDGLMALAVSSVEGDSIHTVVLTDGSLVEPQRFESSGRWLVARCTDRSGQGTHHRCRESLKCRFSGGIVLPFCRRYARS